MKVQVIYLNGPSSAGKSTLAKALQEALDLPFLHIGIDKMIGMMPGKMNNWAGGSARAQYHQVHAGNVYDLEIDTSIFDLKQSVDVIVPKVLGGGLGGQILFLIEKAR